MHFHILAQGTFNNYVDQILPNFDPLPPSSTQLWTFYMIPTRNFEKMTIFGHFITGKNFRAGLINTQHPQY